METSARPARPTLPYPTTHGAPERVKVKHSARAPWARARAACLFTAALPASHPRMYPAMYPSIVLLLSVCLYVRAPSRPPAPRPQPQPAAAATTAAATAPPAARDDDCQPLPQTCVGAPATIGDRPPPSSARILSPSLTLFPLPSLPCPPPPFPARTALRQCSPLQLAASRATLARLQQAFQTVLPNLWRAMKPPQG